MKHFVISIAYCSHRVSPADFSPCFVFCLRKREFVRGNMFLRALNFIVIMQLSLSCDSTSFTEIALGIKQAGGWPSGLAHLAQQPASLVVTNPLGCESCGCFFICFYSSMTYPCVYVCIPSLGYSSTHLPIHPSSHSLIHSYSHQFIHLFIHLFTYVHSFMQCLC